MIAPKDVANLLVAIRDAARLADPQDAPRILRALEARLADGSLAEATAGMRNALEQAEDDLDHGHAWTALLGIAWRAALALEVEAAGS